MRFHKNVDNDTIYAIDGTYTITDQFFMLSSRILYVLYTACLSSVNSFEAKISVMPLLLRYWLLLSKKVKVHALQVAVFLCELWANLRMNTLQN
jgi:hypothetical protein